MITRTKCSNTEHKACVCVICDCFIIGVEPIYWLLERQLKSKESVISVDFLEGLTGKTLPPDLRNQYMI